MSMGKIFYTSFSTCSKSLKGRFQSACGFLNQLFRQPGISRFLNALTSFLSCVVVEQFFDNLSATSAPQSDSLGRCTTCRLHSRYAAIRYTALMNTDALVSPLEALFSIPYTVPKQSTFITTLLFTNNSGATTRGISRPIISNVVVLSPYLTPFSSIALVMNFFVPQQLIGKVFCETYVSTTWLLPDVCCVCKSSCI